MNEMVLETIPSQPSNNYLLCFGIEYIYTLLVYIIYDY